MDKTDSEKIKWPSERIAQGGLFHSAKVEFSKETSDLLNLLMKESRISMMVRKKINYHLRNGEPLPLPDVKRPSHQADEDAIALEIIKKARNTRRKTFEAIKNSGAYDIQKYRPKPDLREPCEKAKVRLQEVMAGGKLAALNIKPSRKPRVSAKAKNLGPKEQIDEILQEIEERAEWLAEMEELGEGKQYRQVIQNEISARLREIRNIEKRAETIEQLEKLKEMEKVQSEHNKLF